MSCNSVGVFVCVIWLAAAAGKSSTSLFPQDVVARCDQAAQWRLRHRWRRQWFVPQSLLGQDVCIWGRGNRGQVVLRRIIRCGLRISVRKQIRRLNIKHQRSRSHCCSLINMSWSFSLISSRVIHRSRWTHKHLLRGLKPRQCPQIICAQKKRKSCESCTVIFSFLLFYYLTVFMYTTL